MDQIAGRTLLDRYFLRELVGSGGMADVYLAWDKIRSVKMAIKVLRRDVANNSRFFQQFTKEAEILNRLEHPNIVRLYEFDKDDDLAFIVMDWVDGSNLRQVINATKQVLPLSAISRVLDSVCTALHYAHQNKIYHCDIKPANIMLHTDGRVLLTDFGVAHLADETGGGGTPPYMAPEQFSGGAIDARTDIYALGITLYEILSGGAIPYRGKSTSSQGSTTKERIAWEHLYLNPPSLREVNPNISSALEKMVTKALNKEPGTRFQTTLEFRDAFEAARANSPEVSVSSAAPQTLADNLSTIANSMVSAAAEAATRIVPKPALEDMVRKLSATVAPQQQGGSPSSYSSGRQSSSPSTRPVGQPPVPSAGSKGPYLLGRTGQWASQQIAIPMGEVIIGRGSQSHIKLSENSVSRRHATIIHTKRGLYIRDDGSSLGTYVNGARITGPVLLRDRDVIQIGYQQVFEVQTK